MNISIMHKDLNVTPEFFRMALREYWIRFYEDEEREIFYIWINNEEDFQAVKKIIKNYTI